MASGADQVSCRPAGEGRLAAAGMQPRLQAGCAQVCLCFPGQQQPLAPLDGGTLRGHLHDFHGHNGLLQLGSGLHVLVLVVLAPSFMASLAFFMGSAWLVVDSMTFMAFMAFMATAAMAATCCRRNSMQMALSLLAFMTFMPFVATA